MDEIVSVTYVENMGAEAFKRGDTRTAHNMNWHSHALHAWLTGWDRAAAQASPESHIAPHRRAGVDARQVEAA